MQSSGCTSPQWPWHGLGILRAPGHPALVAQTERTVYNLQTHWPRIVEWLIALRCLSRLYPSKNVVQGTFSTWPASCRQIWLRSECGLCFAMWFYSSLIISSGFCLKPEAGRVPQCLLPSYPYLNSLELFMHKCLSPMVSSLESWNCEVPFLVFLFPCHTKPCTKLGTI